MTSRLHMASIAAGVLALSVVSCTSAVPTIDVALIDTGVVVELPQFADYDIEQEGVTPSGDHGTMMASVILGVVDPKVRALPSADVTLHSYDVGDAPTGEDLADAVRAALDDNVDVISISMGLRRDNADLRAAVAEAHAAGILIVAAAGNYGTTTPDYPARYPEVISVGAIDSAGETWEHSPSEGLDAVAEGVDVPVVTGDGVVVVETGTSISAAAVARQAASQLLSGELDMPAEFIPDAM